MLRYLWILVLLIHVGPAALAQSPPPIKVLFLGDDGHHQPLARFRQLQPVLAKNNLQLTYTSQVADLNPATLAGYDGLMIFANHETWTPANEKALLDFVASGKGFVPLHCASFCFTQSKAYVDLVGAQFRSHTTGVFRVKQSPGDHPILKGFESFASWDETYVHHRHNNTNRTVLETRTDGDLNEPWTWVRTHGKGRIFYTAWGHDHRTWSHPGFHNLVCRGTRWACGGNPADAGNYTDRPAMTAFAPDAKPFEFVPAQLPFYPPGEKWG
ncbi:MAG: ThuA domain-containing protein, partial [Gemmataceae bacterium]